MSKQVRRLFEQFQPEHYDLKLAIDREKMAFSGSVLVRGLKTGRPANRLTFHQKGLKITSAKITKHDKSGDRPLAIKRLNNQNSLDEVRLHAEDTIYPGDYTVEMEFSGKIVGGMNGIYPCPFKHEGKEKMLIATQFESHYARKAFPCVDEPEAKATFSLTLTTSKGDTVLSNTPIKKQAEIDGAQVTTFHTTPRMSTYLLAFVIGEMHSKSTKTKSGVEVSAWATVAQPQDSLDFALDVAKGCVEFFEDYFNVPYPLPKADYVGLPDFAVGAMENWGLMTYRERLLVAYPGETSQSTKEIISLVIGHETAHMWFGDLTTMRWWDDLWLNESFANMMEYEVVNAIFPEWKVWDSFIEHEGLSALRRDATPGIQAVKQAVNHPDEISTLFDHSIVYAKGGRLLFMLKNYIGEDAFRKGLTSYFKKHSYKNTSGSDLWDALSEASGSDVGAFMDPWLTRSGFPVLKVNQHGQKLNIEQEHFLDNPSKSDPDRLWPVPLFASYKTVPKLMNKKSMSATLATDEYARVNRGALGHYIVNYGSPEHRQAIIDLIKQAELNNSERLMLLNDASMLARAGYQRYGDVLKMLEAYVGEASEPVWGMISLIIGEARIFLDLDQGLEDKIKGLVRKLIASEYRRLGWTEKAGEPAADTKLRATIIGLGAYAEEPEIIAKGKQLFKDYQKDPAAVATELRSIVFGIAAKHKVPGAFDYLLGRHDSTDNSNLQADIAAALTSTHSGKEARTLLSRLTNKKLVKAQDADRWLIYLLRNRHTRQIAWEWMESNWGWIEDTYKDEATYDHWPRYASSVCNTQAWADRYKKFFGPRQSQLGLKRNIEVGIEDINNRIDWLNRDLKSVQAFFKNS